MTLRLPPALRRRVDAFAAKMSAETPGLNVSAQQAVIILLAGALDARKIQDPEGTSAPKGAKRTARKP